MELSNSVLKEYLETQAAIKKLEDRLKEIKNFIIYTNGFETEDYVAAVKDASRKQIASIKEFEKKFGIYWLKDNKMVKVITFKLVDVVSRPKKKF